MSRAWQLGRSRCGEGRGRRVPVGVAALIAVVAMVAAACGGGGGGGGGGSASSPAASASVGTPKVGGTLTFGEFSPPVGLDPIVETGAGVTGLIEATAVYDTLLRYNYDTGKYDPGTALSATPNADDTVWTIKLRPGITFTDGTPYDADAVVFGMNRFRIGAPGAPPCSEVRACPGPVTLNTTSWVKDITAVDKTTVQVTLNEPWASFPVLLSAEDGLIPSPTALKKCAAAGPANQCAFNTAPVGAGPFMVTSFKPGEAITMVRNPNYWGGQVYLDGVTFVCAQDGGGQKTLDTLEAGQTQMAFLRDPVAVAAAHDAKLPGYANRAYIGSLVLLLNVGDKSRPTSNLTVRQAIAAAIDPNVVNERAYQGKAQATTDFFPPSFKWYPGMSGPKYDPAQAKKLVAEAKAGGWDGKVGMIAPNAGSSLQAALAIQAMLQAVGIDVALDTSHDIASNQALVAKSQFDIASGGTNVTNDDWSQVALVPQYISTSKTNRVGWKDPAYDDALRQLWAARTDAQKTAAFKAIATQFNEQLPIISLGTLEEFIAWSGNVHGVRPDVRTSVHLDKVWLS